MNRLHGENHLLSFIVYLKLSIHKVYPGTPTVVSIFYLSLITITGPCLAPPWLNFTVQQKRRGVQNYELPLKSSIQTTTTKITIIIKNIIMMMMMTIIMIILIIYSVLYLMPNE